MNRSAAYPALLSVVLSSGCSLFTDPSETIVLEVAETRVSCVGEGPRECLVVRFGSSVESQAFYNEIRGFEHTPGIRYRLLVERTEVENPPADGSSYDYRLERVLSSEPSARADLLAETAAAEALWLDVRPVAYTMTEQRVCFCGSAAYGLVRLNVTRSPLHPSTWEQVTSVTSVETGAEVPEQEARNFRGVQDLFREIRWAIADQAHDIDVSFDPAGYPSRVSIDRRSNVSDDEVAFIVESVSGL